MSEKVEIFLVIDVGIGFEVVGYKFKVFVNLVGIVNY